MSDKIELLAEKAFQKLAEGLDNYTTPKARQIELADRLSLYVTETFVLIPYGEARKYWSGKVMKEKNLLKKIILCEQIRLRWKKEG